MGDGPLIILLASASGVAPITFGRTLRLHRGELVALMDDTTGPDWAPSFLARVEELGRGCGRS